MNQPLFRTPCLRMPTLLVLLMYSTTSTRCRALSIGNAGIIIVLVPLFSLGLSVLWGLSMKGRSTLSALAGIVIVVGAGLGAWGESRSLPWTVAYLMVVLVGLISISRQVRPRK